jgi:hypothetical protein
MEEIASSHTDNNGRITAMLEKMNCSTLVYSNSGF